MKSKFLKFILEPIKQCFFKILLVIAKCYLHFSRFALMQLHNISFFFEKAATIFKIDVVIQKCMILVVTHFSIDLKLFLVNAVNKICDVFDTPAEYAIKITHS